MSSSCQVIGTGVLELTQIENSESEIELSAKLGELHGGNVTIVMLS